MGGTKRKDMENETTTSLPFSPKVGDCVLLKPSEPEEQPYVAKVIDLDNKGQVKLRWFYRPEDVKGGRRRWHGKQELFRSNACDWNPIACIESFCRVLSLEKYELLTKVSPHDYFSRFSFNPAKGTFKPDMVPVYCLCELPYNPDSAMIECEVCNDWFHYECVGLDEESLAGEGGGFGFQCNKCTSGRKTCPAVASELNQRENLAGQCT